MTYADGRCYNGQWKHDHINGFGVMEFKDGSKYDGNWVSMQVMFVFISCFIVHMRKLAIKSAP